MILVSALLFIVFTFYSVCNLKYPHALWFSDLSLSLLSQCPFAMSKEINTVLDKFIQSLSKCRG